ncbi:unnamed protein product, partial [Phaeothamnion confervicola]
RRVEAELGQPTVWRYIQAIIHDLFPNDPDMWLPDQPMRRHHYLYGRTTYLTDDQTLNTLRDLHRQLAADQAQQIGLLNPNGPGSWTHPHLDRVIHADGKVITPLFRAKPGDTHINKITGEIRRLRADPDAALHIEGTGEAVWGSKYVIIATRGEQRNARIILDAAHVVQPGNEAAHAVNMFTDLQPHIPGAQAVIYDGALRGVHHQHFLRNLGLLTVSRVTAAQRVRNKQGKTVAKVDKTTYIETKTIPTPSGPKTIKIFARGGQAGIGELADNGDLTFIPLPRIRTHRTQSKTGTYRWYNDHQLPDHHGNGTLTLRLHGNDDDTKRRLNRTENLRPIPAADPDFEHLYRRRNDA